MGAIALKEYVAAAAASLQLLAETIYHTDSKTFCTSHCDTKICENRARVQKYQNYPFKMKT